MLASVDATSNVLQLINRGYSIGQAFTHNLNLCCAGVYRFAEPRGFRALGLALDRAFFV